MYSASSSDEGVQILNVDIPRAQAQTGIETVAEGEAGPLHREQSEAATLACQVPSRAAPLRFESAASSKVSYNSWYEPRQQR